MNDASGAGSYQTGQSDIRPWGSWSVVATGNGHAVKRIDVSPGSRLSLQLHQNRSEHWIVVSGTGSVGVGVGVGDIPVQAGSHVYVPRQTRHRIANHGAEVLSFIEVQLGADLREDDIVRLEDDFERV